MSRIAGDAVKNGYIELTNKNSDIYLYVEGKTGQCVSISMGNLEAGGIDLVIDKDQAKAMIDALKTFIGDEG